MPEVNAGGFIWIDRIIPFEVLTPLSETDTYAIITRYFNERFDFRFRKNKNIRQLKYTILVAKEFIQLIEKKNVNIRMNVWSGLY